jgi:hypothetical protein
MAFLRFSRDRRGYEHFYLVEATTNRRGKTRARLLYWFRTPPNVKVGREPFDAEVRRILEAQNPGVQFDWRKIVETPIPSADAERWRDKRRAERAERRTRRDAGGKDIPEQDSQSREAFDEPPDEMPPSDTASGDAMGAPPDDVDEDPGGEEFADLAVDAAEQQADSLAQTEESLVLMSPSVETAAISLDRAAEPQTEAQALPSRRRRRRRRRGRGRPSARPDAPGAGQQETASPTNEPADQDRKSDESGE